MKHFAASAFAAIASVSLALPAVAQQQLDIPRQPGETAFEYAQRVDACGGGELLAAYYVNNQTGLRVECRQLAAQNTNGMEGGLGSGALVGGGALMLLFALGGGGSSGTTTTTTTSTTGGIVN